MPLYSNKDLKYAVNGINNHGILIAVLLHFKQIIYNPPCNTVKFTKNGSITLRRIEKLNHWLFQVKDIRIEIPKDDYDDVFKEFGRIESDKIKEILGAGLGLALIKRLINLDGCEICFESELGNRRPF